MKNNLLLTTCESPQVALRSISVRDLENLRNWKNSNRQYFFYRGIISPEDQMRWFEGYLSRKDDYMFVVVAQGKDIGCMGFRELEAGGDIYNVILGLPEFGGYGWMAKAFQIMCSYAIDKYPTRLSAKVVRANPALGWYCRNGFREEAQFPEYVEIALDRLQYGKCLVTEA